MTRHCSPRRGAAIAGAVVLVLAGAGAPAQAALPVSERGTVCVDPDPAAAAKGGPERGRDHRDFSASEQIAVEERTAEILAERGEGRPDTAVEVPVYVHVMVAEDGVTGDVTDTQIAQQVAVLNQTYGGAESADAADTGFTFTLAGVDRFYDDQWHRDKQSRGYRSQTRRGGADALNIWLVDFAFLGYATFPWDYAREGEIDGVRVRPGTLPGGSTANYNLGETATHEVGHWLGLYHVFQGGCRESQGGDQVADTPPQQVATNGCPAGQDSCAGDGVDSIHNYMDYSYDDCYNQFTPDQSARMSDMWTAYRA